MEKTTTDFSKMSIGDNSNINHHLVYIKDKHGVYVINPFIDPETKLLEIKNCSSLLLSPKNIAV